MVQFWQASRRFFGLVWLWIKERRKCKRLLLPLSPSQPHFCSSIHNKTGKHFLNRTVKHLATLLRPYSAWIFPWVFFLHFPHAIFVLFVLPHGNPENAWEVKMSFNTTFAYGWFPCKTAWNGYGIEPNHFSLASTHVFSFCKFDLICFLTITWCCAQTAAFQWQSLLLIWRSRL